MKEPLISVIVPVYKAEKYLDQCVQSIVNQTYRNLEIILVNDGSPDNCPIMCDEWAVRDLRIKVIHKENGGAGKARNEALDIATGEYISFIDSDDYIECHMYEHLLALMENDIDIAECGIIKTKRDDLPLDDGSKFQSKVYDVVTAMKLHISDSIFCQTPPNKLYRRCTIGDVRFPVGMRIDDEFWTYRVIARARKLVRTSCNMYAYRQQPESVMHRAFSFARLQAVEAKCQRFELIKKQFPSLCSVARINLWYTCLYLGQMSLKYMNGEEQKKVFKILGEVWGEYHVTYSDIQNISAIQKVWAILTKVSIKNTCRLRNSLKIGV